MLLLSKDRQAHAQHVAVRKVAGWFDYTHRLIEVTGPDAAAFLDGLYVNDIAGTAVGRARYTVMLFEDGTICDDVVVFRLAEDDFWVSTLFARDEVRIMGERKGDADVSFRDITSEWNMYSVQGPVSPQIVDAIAAKGSDGLRFFQIRDDVVAGAQVRIAKAGYTGEKNGFEVYVRAEDTAAVEQAIDEAAKALGATHVTEIDVMMKTLACEAGLLLMPDMRKLTPIEVGLDRYVKWDKAFVGKEALLARKDQPLKRTLMGFTVADPDALIYGGPLNGESGAHVYLDGSDEGRVTKFTYGFTVDSNIGYAVVDPRAVKIGDHVTINGYDAVMTKVGILR